MAEAAAAREPGKMEILHFSLKALQPFAQNPRKIGEDARRRLRKSIQRFGLFKPLLVWQGTDHPEGITAPIVIGGNQRYLVLSAMAEAGELPMEIDLSQGRIRIDGGAIPCIRFPGSWGEARVVALRDNASDGEWDWDSLPGYVEELNTTFQGIEGWDPELMGFDENTLNDLEALASDALVGVDRFHGEKEEAEEGKGEKGKNGKDGDKAGTEGTSFLTRKNAQVVLGNIRGKIPVALYEKWAGYFQRYSSLLSTTHLPSLMEAMGEDVEAALKRREKRSGK